MKLAVVGTGYVGLVTGAGFSDFGHDVTCVDIDTKRVETLRRGEVPFYDRQRLVDQVGAHFPSSRSRSGRVGRDVIDAIGLVG